MASGTLANMATSAFVPTRHSDAARICQHLLALPTGGFSVLDPTAGAGHLLLPFAAYSAARIYGVELSEERAALARAALPRAQIVTSPFERVRIAEGSVDLIVSNPPYMQGEIGRMEYAIIRDATAALRPGNPHIAILPARQWDGAMARLWARRYERVQCWMLAPDEFAKHTQIVVAGVKRERPRDTPDPLTLARLRGFRYRADPTRPAASPWAQGFAPDVLPDAPIAEPYRVTPGGRAGEITVLNADQAELLRGLEMGGAHLQPAWRSATAWQADAALAAPLMPISGEAYLAALILTGALDGEELQGPDGQWYAFSTHIATEWVAVEVDEDQRRKGVTSISQQQDRPCLSVLSLATGALAHYQREEVFAFLTPWLPILAQRALAQHAPRYALDPPDWMLRVAMTIAQDKTLPGSTHAGLLAPQLHRSFAGYTALCQTGRFAINGEPGTGKTRMHILIMALFAHTWQRRHSWAGRLPRWVKRVRRAWRANPRVAGDAPRALPLAVMTPMRVVPVWQQEIAGSWPEAEVVAIRTHADVRRWMDRCAVSDAPAVVALFSQSTTRAFGRAWQPAVLAQAAPIAPPDLRPPAARPPELEELRDATGALIASISEATEATLPKDERQLTFRCPDCYAVVEAAPGSLRRKQPSSADAEAREADAEAKREPVRSLTWFADRPRRCEHCGSALWTDARTASAQARYPQIPFHVWSQAVDAPAPAARAGGRARPRIIAADGARGPAAPDSFSPYEYWHRRYRGLCAFVEIDESHNLRGQATDIAHSGHLAQRASQTYGYGSGTHYGGILTDFFAYWHRFNPQFWKRLGLGWHDADQAIRRYGVVQTVTREVESRARRGSGTVDTTISTIPAPGVSTRLLPYLLADLAFIDVLDVGAFMPPREEIPVIVDMDDPALAAAVQGAQAALAAAEAALAEAERQLDDAPHDQLSPARARRDGAADQVARARQALADARAWAAARDLKRSYAAITDALGGMAERRNSAARLAQGTLPRWWSILPMWEQPQYTVSETRRGDWGDVERVEEIFRAPALASDHRYPLERTLGEIVAAEVGAGRPVMVYVEQNDVRSTTERLRRALAEFAPWALPNRVAPEDREAAINAAVDAGKMALIVPYRRVLEGLNLQKIKTIVWYELAMNLFMLDQASRRSWRLGQDALVRLYYLAYRGTATHKQLIRLGSKSGAAALFAGNTPDGALAKAAGADKTTLAKLARGLEADAEIDLAAAFRRRGEELAAKLAQGRAWLGTADTLAARLAATAQPAPPRAAPITSEPSAEPSAADAQAAASQAAVRFGDLAAIAAVLRAARKRRRAAPAAPPAGGQLALL